MCKIVYQTSLLNKNISFGYVGIKHMCFIRTLKSPSWMQKSWKKFTVCMYLFLKETEWIFGNFLELFLQIRWTDVQNIMFNADNWHFETVFLSAKKLPITYSKHDIWFDYQTSLSIYFSCQKIAPIIIARFPNVVYTTLLSLEIHDKLNTYYFQYNYTI